MEWCVERWCVEDEVVVCASSALLLSLWPGPEPIGRRWRHRCSWWSEDKDRGVETPWRGAGGCSPLRIDEPKAGNDLSSPRAEGGRVRAGIRSPDDPVPSSTSSTQCPPRGGRWVRVGDGSGGDEAHRKGGEDTLRRGEDSMVVKESVDNTPQLRLGRKTPPILARPIDVESIAEGTLVREVATTEPRQASVEARREHVGGRSEVERRADTVEGRHGEGPFGLGIPPAPAG